MNRIVYIFLLLFIAWSCKNDDDVDIITVPPQTLAETAIENDADIKEYLQTHFYNYEEFETPAEDFDYKIKFDVIAGDNAGKTALIDQVKTELITELASSFGREDEEEVQHTLYYLVVNLGSGESPTIGDNSILTYEGGLLDGTLFDASTSPVNFNLSRVVKGFGNAVEKFNTGEGPVDNGDGSVSFQDFGIGAVFMPSGLGYFDDPFNQAPSTIANYSPLVFTFGLLSYEMDTDLDGDGIPSILEDLNGDGNLDNDNTDADLEAEFSSILVPNFADTDDDGDGIDTIDEIEVDANGKFVSFKDTDGDGIYDHLDNDN